MSCLTKLYALGISSRRLQQYHLSSKHLSTFSEYPQTNIFNSHTCSNLLVTHDDESNPDLPLLRASQCLKSGNKLDSYVLVYLIRECTNLGHHFFGQQLHCHVLLSGFGSNVFVSTALVNFYVKFDLVTYAHDLFDEIHVPSVVSWNSLISGYVHSGQFRKALDLFLQLERSIIWSDSFSLTGALSASGQLSLMRLGKCIHSKIVKLGVECSLFVGNCLIDMYGKCGSVDDAIQIFHGMDNKDTITWNSVIAACARNQRLRQALSFLHNMPNPDTISYNEMINGIAQFGNIKDAIEILSKMPNPNSSSWNSVVTGYVNRGRAREALDVFSKMHSSDVTMDQFTFSILLSGIASLSALTWGTVIHCYTVKYGLDTSVVVGSALIDMYSKTGQVKRAESIFQSLPEKNLVTWNAMISGYAHNGNYTEVLQLFEHLKMVKGLQPDGITFLNVLSACWHNRLPLEVANWYFESMTKDYAINPTAEHCSSIIRLMGQEGEVWRAEKMINELGFASCGMVWKSLLGACVPCGDIEVAKAAAAKVIELEGDDEFVYVSMSNIYAQYGKWGDVGAVRKLMRARRVKKEVGCSWIEVER
ncbi:hypothetical protein RJ640_012859 [Escallonia rubra]|uniref:Chlororespiratory reduction 4 n=1 Tax=Escallonia rubra TaxID=112253 RepID=A0AA88QXI1_9ASTE|nr:hypothetical protein RJ640_012859 [Escallonia rubra]